jgi:hypothetical protein
LSKQISRVIGLFSRLTEERRTGRPVGLLALIPSLFRDPETNKMMATVHWSGRNQITQPT